MDDVHTPKRHRAIDLLVVFSQGPRSGRRSSPDSEILHPPFLFLRTGGVSCVDVLGVMMIADHLDEAFLTQEPNCLSSQRRVDLQALAYSVRGDEARLRDVSHQLVVGRLVKQDIVVQLVLALSLGPLLQTNEVTRNPAEKERPEGDWKGARFRARNHATSRSTWRA